MATWVPVGCWVGTPTSGSSACHQKEVGARGRTGEAAWTPRSLGIWQDTTRSSAPFLPHFVLISPQHGPFLSPGRGKAAEPQHRGLHVGEVTASAPQDQPISSYFPAHLTHFQHISCRSNPFSEFSCRFDLFPAFFFRQNNLVLAFSSQVRPIFSIFLQNNSFTVFFPHI